MEDKNTVLDKVKELIYNDRRQQYGTIRNNMLRTGELFESITGIRITANECILFMVCHKLARESCNQKDDNIIDAIGYLALYYDEIHLPKE